MARSRFEDWVKSLGFEGSESWGSRIWGLRAWGVGISGLSFGVLGRVLEVLGFGALLTWLGIEVCRASVVCRLDDLGSKSFKDSSSA